MRIIDYREYNPETAIALTRMEAEADYSESLLTCSLQIGNTVILEDREPFVKAYVDSYMDGACWSDQQFSDCEDAIGAIDKLRDKRDELQNSIDTVTAGPCAWNGDELAPSARHDVAFYTALLQAVEDDILEAVYAYQLIVDNDSWI